MRNRINFLLALLLLSAQLSAQEDKLINEQRRMIGELTGKFEWNGQRLQARSSSEERALVRKYLKNKIHSLRLEPMEQAYLMPNLNPLIDLLFSPFKGANIYTVLEATEKSDEYIVLGAHFDTEVGCPGAIDNGTGVALIFSVVKQLQSLDFRSKNIILVFFDQEEEELVGSQAFAQFLKDEKMRINSVHTFDMVGWDDDGNNEMELELPTAYLEEVYRKKADELEIPLYVTSINSTDHHSFRQVGFSAIGVNEAYGKRDSTPYKDTPQDTFETVNFDFLAKSTWFVYEVMKEMVGR